MDIKQYNIYEHLRDFGVPSTVLDNIFSSEDDLAILVEAWKSLLNEGIAPDQGAKKISEIIFKDLDIEPDHSFDEEK